MRNLNYGYKVELIELFKVPLFVSLLDLDITSIEKYCLDYRDRDEGRILSNVGGYQSNNVEIAPLAKEISNRLNMFSEAYSISNELEVGNMWININGFKDYNKLHSHHNALFSGVYYVKTPDKCGNIVFDNPSQDAMEHTYHNTKFKGYNSFNSITHWRQAKENSLLVFPGWLKHGVEPNLSNEKRISISFNILQRL